MPSDNDIQIHGTVAEGFEPVRDLYEKNLRTLAERNTQLCVYLGDTCVVDLWGSAVNDTAFSADSLVNVFSSGKSLEAITLAMLVSRGLLDYQARIADYWPEYAKHGKEETTVADLMRHEAGLAAFDTAIEPRDLQPDRLRENAVGNLIERQTARYRPGPDQRREYHAITRGWIAGELLRRVDPAGRTMGEFLRDEVAEPLGIDVHIGVPDAAMARISPVKPLGLGFQMRQGMIPRAMGRKMELNLLQMVAKVSSLLPAARERTTKGMPPALKGMRSASFIDSPEVASSEIPSAGAKCSARGLARLAAVMANEGNQFGHTLMSDQAHELLHAAPQERSMMALTTTFSQGGLASFPQPRQQDTRFDRELNRGREGFYGWMGLGGSIFQWHPKLRIGFGYVPTSLNILDLVNARGKSYQAAVVECVNRLSQA